MAEPNIVRTVSLPAILYEQDKVRIQRARYALQRYPQKMLGLLLAHSDSDEERQKWTTFYQNHPFFSQVCAGARHHHYWVGGLEDHCLEMTGFAFDLVDLYRGDWANRVTKREIVQAVYLHDFAKIWQYEKITEEERIKALKTGRPYHEKQCFKIREGAFDMVNHETKTLLELMKYGIVLEERVASAVMFAEGGYAEANFDWGGTTRTADRVNTVNALAPLIHMADMFSSQVLGASIA